MKQYIKVILSMLCLIFCFSSTAEAEFEWNHPCTWGGGVYDFCDERTGDANIEYDRVEDGSAPAFRRLSYSGGCHRGRGSCSAGLLFRETRDER